jgi:hypothetical protein
MFKVVGLKSSLPKDGNVSWPGAERVFLAKPDGVF